MASHARTLSLTLLLPLAALACAEEDPLNPGSGSGVTCLLPNAITGMLFAGFWVSLSLSVLDFGFYLVVTARQRLFTFAVLRSLGWNAGHIWRLLLIEQVTLVTPALIIGSIIGAGLAYLLLPFLALVGQETLRIPWLQLVGMLTILALSFTALMGIAAMQDGDDAFAISYW